MGIVKELSQECLPKLRDILESQMPNSLIAHGFVSSLIQYDLQELRTQVFVALETSFRTFLVLTPTSSWEGVQSITVYYEEERQPEEDGLADEELAKLMESVPGLDWTKPVYLYGCNHYVLTRIRRLMNSGRLMADPRYHSVSQVHAYVLSREDSDEASQIRLVEGYTLGRLTPAHAEWVHDHWLYKHTETKDFFWGIISNFPSVAAFEEIPAENEMTRPKDGVLQSLPVAWILKYPDGAIGSTFTLPEHRRKGLARLVSLSLSRKVGDLCSPVFVFVDDTNTASIEFHEKMGFRRACPFIWETYAPSDALEELASGEGRDMLQA
ncbi:uncharacterized protein LOC143034047 [Oratosquilla oratoria]|uniref:uncharacterized protein LOC143034047 n=1 Tax=Oratosquilla oratoria TaxID=337810 RepID=UPI003F77142C